MLSRGFKDQIYEIFQYIPKNSQVALFSATMPNEALDLTTRFMDNPVKILVKNDELTLEGIKQFYIPIETENYKFETLCDLYSVIAIAQAIIYCNSKRKADWIKDKLIANGFTVECLHGDMKQKERDDILKGFRNGGNRILLATDIISRGIAIPEFVPKQITVMSTVMSLHTRTHTHTHTHTRYIRRPDPTELQACVKSFHPGRLASVRRKEVTEIARSLSHWESLTAHPCTTRMAQRRSSAWDEFREFPRTLLQNQFDLFERIWSTSRVYQIADSSPLLA
jgi:hypothetical protein